MLGSLVIAYLFLGGTGAGLGAVTALFHLLSPRQALGSGTNRLYMDRDYRPLLLPPLVAALFMLAVSTACLVADLGVPERVFLMVAPSELTIVNAGAYALVVSMALCLVLSLVSTGRGVISLRLARVLQVLAIASCLVVMGYTGLLLMQMSGASFYENPALPLLFTLSSLSCGYGAFSLVAMLTKSGYGFHTALVTHCGLDRFVVILEAVALAALLLLPVHHGAAAELASQSVRELTAGTHALPFWCGVVGCGIVIPLVLELRLYIGARRGDIPSPLVLLTLGIVLLIGGCCLRYCIVEVGFHAYLGVGSLLQ